MHMQKQFWRKIVSLWNKVDKRLLITWRHTYRISSNIIYDLNYEQVDNSKYIYAIQDKSKSKYGSYKRKLTQMCRGNN